MTVNLAAPLSAVAMRKLQRKYVGQPAQNNTVRSIYEAAPADLPIVIASALTYFPMKWYAPPFLRERLHYLADLQYAVKQPDFLPELSMTINQNLFPVKVDNYRTFIEGNKRFVLYCTGEPRLEWVKQRLLDEGWKLELIEKQGVEELYLATRPGN